VLASDRVDQRPSNQAHRRREQEVGQLPIACDDRSSDWQNVRHAEQHQHRTENVQDFEQASTSAWPVSRAVGRTLALRSSGFR
jgi:hypothetical protein